jgi:hypothetical protein
MFKLSFIGFLGASVLAGSFCIRSAAQSSSSTNPPAESQTAAPPTTTPAPSQSTAPAHRRFRPNQPPKRAAEYYQLIWGVDTLHVKSVESGELIRFTYRVVDASKAEALNDKKEEPSLIAPRAGVRLEIPQLEKVGKLRQSSPPEAGKSYWMAFSNKGRIVKPGDRVSVVIGKFRADGLVVE